MKIGLNLLPLRPGVGGSWNYVASLLAALAEHDRENEYVAFATEASAGMVPARFACEVVKLPAKWRPLRVLYENSALRLMAGHARVDCVHHFFGSLPHFAHVPSVVTIHDLMVFERPGDFSLIKRTYLRRMERRTAEHATIISPVSRSTGEHMNRLLGVAWERMVVVPAAVSATFARADNARVKRFRERYSLPKEFWVAVSGAYPHKNYDRLIQAYSALRNSRPDAWPLVVRADPMERVRALAAKHGVERDVVLLPRLDDGEMPVLYSAASALIFPSLFEGGGIPVMEAMACGLPVVASDIPTTREFAGDASLRFDPTSASAIRDAMAKCEESPELRARLRDAGLAAAHRFDPAVIVPACLEAYGKAARRRASK